MCERYVPDGASAGAGAGAGASGAGAVPDGGVGAASPRLKRNGKLKNAVPPEEVGKVSPRTRAWMHCPTAGAASSPEVETATA